MRDTTMKYRPTVEERYENKYKTKKQENGQSVLYLNMKKEKEKYI